MKNIISIIKFNIFNKIRLIIWGIAFLVLIMLFGIFRIFNVPVEIVGINSVAVGASLLGVYFILSLLKMCVQLSKERGRMLFMAPIKGWEYLSAKIIEFAIIQVIAGSIIVLVSILGGVTDEFLTVILIPIYGVVYGTIVGYIVVASFIILFASYIKSLPLCILATFFGVTIISVLAQIIIRMVSGLFPYVYIAINDIIYIDVISTVLGLGAMVLLFIIASKEFDDSLEIN